MAAKGTGAVVADAAVAADGDVADGGGGDWCHLLNLLPLLPLVCSHQRANLSLSTSSSGGDHTAAAGRLSCLLKWATEVAMELLWWMLLLSR